MLKQYLRFNRLQTLFLLALIPVCMFIEVSVSLVLELITDIATNKISLPYWGLVAIVMAYICVDSGAYFAEQYSRERWLNVTTSRVRSRLMSQYLAADEPLAGESGETQNRFNQFTNNIGILQDDYLRSSVLIYSEGWQLVIALTMSALIHPLLCLIIVLLCVPSLLIPVASRKLLSSAKLEVVRASEAYTTILQGILAGLRTIQLLNVGRLMKNRFEQTNTRWLATQNYDQRQRKIVNALSQFVDDFMYLGTWVGGIYFVMNKTITLAQLVAFSQLIIFVADPLQTGATLLTDYIGSREVAKTFAHDLLPVSADETVSDLEGVITIDYRNVSLTHQGQAVLNGVDLHLDGHKRYLIIGETGAGKSSLLTLPLLARGGFNGDILMNGTPQADLNLATIRGQIGLVEQSGAIFAGTLRESLTFERTPEDDLFAALDQAQLSRYATHAGLSKRLTPTGAELSGGEKKRLFLARILLKAPAFMLLDEPTSGLDPKTATAIEHMLTTLPGGWAMVTHRYNPALFAAVDSIIVMHQGRIAAQGPVGADQIQQQLIRLRFIS